MRRGTVKRVDRKVAESAVALAEAGYDVVVTARTLVEGERHDHLGSDEPLPGSLESTAGAVRRAGREVLALPADILDPGAAGRAAAAALSHFGRVDLLFNNAVYQGVGNQARVLDVTPEQLQAIYQANLFTPLALVQAILPAMLEAGGGTVINMLSATAFLDPPAPADEGGWGFAYPSSKAALGRMSGALRAEHAGSGLRVFNLEPGTVVTEVMKKAGIDRAVLERFRPCEPAAIASVVAWLADNDPPGDWDSGGVLRGPAIARSLGLLQQPSYLESGLS